MQELQDPWPLLQRVCLLSRQNKYNGLDAGCPEVCDKADVTEIGEVRKKTRVAGPITKFWIRPLVEPRQVWCLLTYERRGNEQTQKRER